MLLPGRLSATTLGDLLGMLHRERITGQLELREMGLAGKVLPYARHHRIFLETGLVVDVETDLPVPRLGEFLRREGLLGDESLRRLLRRLKAGDRRTAGEILVGERLLSPEVVGVALRRQLCERMDALFTIADASVAFHPARPRPVPAWRIGPLPPSAFLHGRPRSRDKRRGEAGGPASAASPRSRRGWAEGPASWREPPRSEVPRSEIPPRSEVRVTPLDEMRVRACQLLGVSLDADEAEVRRAFRRLASELHPDCHGAAGEDAQRRMGARFAALSAAYHLLVA